MPALDLKKQLKELYSPSAKVVSVVDVPPLNFIMVDGSGNPNTSVAYRQAVEALYGVAYTIKFALKKVAGAPAFAVPPLEGLWWADDMDAFLTADKDAWSWTMMIMQPPHVSADDVARAVAQAKAKNPSPGLDLIRFESYHEGLSAQMVTSVRTPPRGRRSLRARVHRGERLRPPR